MKKVSSRGAFLLMTASLLLPPAITAGDGVVALQTADPSCGNTISGVNYVDCGNGTVTDNRTGLVWLADASCLGLMGWDDAMATVAGLSDLGCGPAEPGCDCGLNDGSSPGEWRLASRKEWKAMVADAASAACSPTITTDWPSGPFSGTCWWEGCDDFGTCSFSDVQASFYWSASSVVTSPNLAWAVSLNTGDDLEVSKSGSYSVWPVRGGQ